MPASRPIWKGQLRLSLVSIAVELYSATKPNAKPAFRQIHEPSGKPINYEKVVAGIGPVDKDEIIKGFEYEKGDYVLLTEKEIDAVKLETRKTLELTQFVGLSEIDPIYFDKPYFVVPADELAEDAFRVIRDALRESQKIGLGQLALRGKEYLVAIKPTGTGLLLETLHYEDEIRKSDSFFSEISGKKADADLLEVATALIDKKTARFDAGVFKDHYQSALRELIARKLKSKSKKVVTSDEPAEPEATGSNVVDLMAALKSSLEGVHVIAPLKPVTEWDDVKAFCKTFAHRMADREPDRFVATMSKAKREGKLFIDYLRNERGSTAVAPWSIRSRQGAPVAVPIGWNELETIKAANQFSLDDAAARAALPDPWTGYFSSTQSITKAMRSAVAG